jgi:O-antigen/teichoic acid export membrane protein
LVRKINEYPYLNCMKIFDTIRTFISKGETRSVKFKQNILLLMVFKGGNMLIGILLLPLTLGYVNSESYGIWLTISSIIGWMSFFDIGLNNGLKNRFAECRANGNDSLAQKYVSTTYALMTLIFIPILITFLCINPLIDWEAVLNVKSNENLNTIFAIVVAYFSINFILSTINIILIADQRPADSAFRAFIQQLSTLILIFILIKITNGSIVNLCIALCLVPLLITLLFNFTLFSGRYKKLSPKLSSVNFSLAKDLLGLGSKFFILQAAAVILFQMTNFIIIRFYSAIDVTLYNVAYKYFSILIMILATMTGPLWSAVTDAVTKQDITWIQNTIKKYSYLLLFFFVAGLVMLLTSDFFYKLWMGDSIGKIPLSLSLVCMISAYISMSASIYVNVLLGAGYLKLQMLFCYLSPILFLLLNYIFIYILHLGVYCIVLANIISNFYGLLIAPIQCYLVFFKNKKGLWRA